MFEILINHLRMRLKTKDLKLTYRAFLWDGCIPFIIPCRHTDNMCAISVQKI